MKQGWEIKKLGEVCKIQTGKLDANAKVDNGEYPFFTCDSKPYKIDKYAFDDEAILISGNGSLVGHVNYYKGKFNAYQRTYVLTKFNSFHLPFLICFLKRYLRPYIVENKKGGCIPYITLPILQNFSIPCPPLPEQEKIVAELDCLSGIIEKKKQQLKELDALAQSIFYEMFGDPVTNEKGWEVKKLKDVCLRITDGTHNSPKSYPTGKYKYITAKNIKKDGFDMSNITYVLEDIHRSIYDRCNPAFGDILYIKDGATTGIAMINTLNEEFSLLSSVALLKCDNSKILNLYLRDMLNTPSLYRSIRDNMGGVAITRLTLKKIEEISILLPPLPLQQTFASKMEAIEKQKELIKQSINEVETLFNSRMQEYFG